MASGEAISREFSFIQELIWSAPYRNPFPKCSDKVLWGLKAARTAQEQESCVESDALMLIDLRRALCSLLASLRATEYEEAKLVKLEGDLDDILTQHILDRWKDETNLQALDEKAIMTDVKQRLEPITFLTAEPAVSSVSFITCDEDAAKDADEPDVKPVPRLEMVKVESLPLPREKGVTENTKPITDVLDVEMTMRATVYQADNEEPCWNVIFGLINHSCNKVDVEALSFWPQDGSREATTITWGRGEMILNENLSFVCYSVKVPASGLLDSPRMCFSWSYKKSSKQNKRPRTKTRDMCNCSMEMEFSTSKQEEPAHEDTCIGKRIRSLFGWRTST